MRDLGRSDYVRTDFALSPVKYRGFVCPGEFGSGGDDGRRPLIRNVQSEANSFAGISGDAPIEFTLRDLLCF